MLERVVLMVRQHQVKYVEAEKLVEVWEAIFG